MILEGYYVQPICSPTRSSLMTGRYTYRLGTQASLMMLCCCGCCSCSPRSCVQATVIRADVPFGVPLKERFLAQNMQDAGYHTALFGKW